MAINQDMTTETVVAVERKFPGLANAEEALTVHVWPLITHNAAPMVGTLMLAALAFWTLMACRRRLKAMRRAPAPVGEQR